MTTQGERTIQQRQPALSHAAVVAALADQERLAALRAADLLDAAPEPQLDRLTRLAARTLGCPIALISVLDEQRHICKSVHGLPEPWASRRELPLTYSYCQFVVALGEPFIIADARQHPLTRRSPSVQALGAVAYAGMPLRLEGRHVLGALAAVDAHPREWQADELDLLRDLADAVMEAIEARLEARRLRARLAEAERGASAEQQVERDAKRDMERDAKQDVERDKDEFLALVAHELRTPLTSLKMQTQMILRQLSQGGTLSQPPMARMQQAVARIERLVNSLVETSRIQSHELELEVASCDLHQLCIAAAQEQREASGRAIELDLPDQPCVVRCDADRVEQVLDNLLSNALKYSPPSESVRLELRCQVNQAEVHVRDRGAGVPEDALPHVFDRFYRAPRVEVQSGSHVGLGLGLFISRQIVERHGGRIWVESAVGSGSTFAFALPLNAPRV